MTETATVLRNSTPFDLIKSDVDDLCQEARTWLGGNKVERLFEGEGPGWDAHKGSSR